MVLQERPIDAPIDSSVVKAAPRLRVAFAFCEMLGPPLPGVLRDRETSGLRDSLAPKDGLRCGQLGVGLTDLDVGGARAAAGARDLAARFFAGLARVAAGATGVTLLTAIAAPRAAIQAVSGHGLDGERKEQNEE